MTAHETFLREDAPAGSSDRVFGLVFAVVFLVVGALPLRKELPPRIWALVASGFFLTVSAGYPAALGPLNRAWTRFGLLLNKVTSPVIMGVLFFIVITPAAVLMRLLGKNPLRLGFDRESPSYWIARDDARPANESMRHQF